MPGPLPIASPRYFLRLTFRQDAKLFAGPDGVMAADALAVPT